MQLDDLSLELLEPVLQRMVQLIGVQATFAVVDAHGGTLLNIPYKAYQNTGLVALIGAENATLLGREFGNERPYIPKAQAAMRQLRDQVIARDLARMSCRQVARAHRLSERMVWKIRNKVGVPYDPDTADLFD